MFRQRFKQTGVALISVLLIVAILMAVASRLLAGHNLVISQHQNTFEQNQALHYVLGAETLASQALFQDKETTKTDHLEEIWAQNVLPFELDEGGFLEAQVRDLNSCFNLNNLASDTSNVYHTQFKSLLTQLALPEALADSWRDWVDDDDIVSGFGAENSEYLVAQPPHRTPKGPAGHVSELALIQGMEPDMLAQLLPYVCAVPDKVVTKLNVNTANPQVLAALSDDIELGAMEEIAGTPRNYNDVTEFVSFAADGTTGPRVSVEDDDDDDTGSPRQATWSELLSVESQYFQLHAQAQVGETSVTLLSLLWRDPISGRVTVLQRDFGKLFRSNVTVTTEPAS